LTITTANSIKVAYEDNLVCWLT